MGRRTVPEKFEFARSIIIAMTGNAYFPNPSPALSTIASNADNLQAAHVAAQTRAKGTVAIMDAMEQVLHVSLWQLAHYVEAIANATPENAEAIIQSAGMEVKKTYIQKPCELHVASTNKGEVTLTCPYTRGGSYRWEVSTGDPTIEMNWELLEVVRQTKLVYNGLISGNFYHFRFWTIGTKGIVPVSQVVSTTVL